MKPALAGVAGFLAIALASQSADAWYHRGYYGTASGGGGSWSAHGYRGGSASGGGGSWSAESYRGGTASGSGGTWTAQGTSGGSASGDGRLLTITTPSGTTASGYGTPYRYGGSYYSAYHPPAVVDYYGSGCYHCGGWAAGAVAAGVVADAAVTSVPPASPPPADGSAQPPPPPPSPPSAPAAVHTVTSIYTSLPPGCAFKPVGAANYYQCAGYWLEPAFGANGVFYRTVPAP